MGIAKTLKASVVIAGGVSPAFRAALATTKNGLKAIGEEITKVEKKQRLMSQSIAAFGKQGRNVEGLRRKYAELTRDADRLRTAQARLARVEEMRNANAMRRRELGSKFRDATATFGVVAAATFAPIRSAMQFETAMLGVAKQLSGARDVAGNLTPAYFRMSKQVQRLGREIPIATNELADMVAAGLRMGVAENQVISFTRTAAMMADAFELPAGQLADDMGKIAGLFHIPIPRIGELADAINYLDDKSQATGSGIIDVLRRVGGMAQTLKMPAKEAAALGSTFLHLGSSAEVAATASNAVMRILGAATIQSKSVRSGLSSIGFAPESVQRSMAKDATSTIQAVMDKLNALNSEQRMVASTRIFGAEYGDDIAKLATGTDEYRRQLALVRGEEQKGSMAREFNARLKTTSAQWQLTKNRMTEVGVAIGGALLPALNDLLKSAAPMVEKFAEWSAANPGMVKGVIGTALALSGLRVVATGFAYAFTAAKGPVISVMGFIARWRATGALAAMGRFGPIAMRVVTVLRTVGTAIAAIGGGPVAIVVAALTAGALIIRKYWQPIKAFLGGVFDGLRDTAGPAIAELRTALGGLKPAWDAVTSAMREAWGVVVDFLKPVGMTREEFESAANAGRAFGSVIGAVMRFTIGQVTNVVNAIAWVAKHISVVARAANMISGFGIAKTAVDYLAGSDAPERRSPLALPPAQGRKAPPLPAATPRGKTGGAAAGSKHVYHITQLPGESSEELARRIAAEQDRRDAAKRRGSLADAA